MKRDFKYAIAAGHELTADTAFEVLKAGGNIFDATIAAFITAWVAEPCMASAGGGGFATIQTANGQSKVLDFFCQTPAQKRPVKEVNFYPVEIDFGATTEIFHIGRGSAAVPGAVAGVFEMHRHYGYMPMKELVYPAIKAAKEGVRLNDFQHEDLTLLKPIIDVSERGKAQFFKADQLKDIGDVVKMPFLADFLEYLAIEGPNAFYQGEVAEKLIADQQNNGGYLSKSDLANYQVLHHQPLSFSFQDRQILTNPLPSKGGQVLKTFLEEWAADTTPVNRLSENHLNKLHQVFYKMVADAQKEKEALNEKRGSTTHIGIMDNQGNGISLTVSNGEGCGHFIEGTDIHLNNMLGEAALMPEGFHNWQANTRMFSMMSPTLVLDHDKTLEMVLGSGGAGRIPYAIGQVLLNLIHFNQPLATAINSPRVHLQEGVFNIEPGFEVDHPSFVTPHKIWTAQSMYFGGTHTVLAQNGGLDAFGDERRDGVFRLG